MLNNAQIVITVAILFGLTIFVHELGHFLVARWCGFQADVFSIGFGPALWKRKFGGTVYKIGMIPFGGYVALPQLDPTGMSLVQGTPEDSPESAPRILPVMPAWKRILVSMAGAVGNILFAIVLAWAVYLIGKPATPAEQSALVGYVATNSGAYASGLRIGDEVRSVNGEPIHNWTDFLMACSRYKTVDVTFVRQGTQQVISMPGEESLFKTYGRSLCMVFVADPGMSAARAGLKRGDIITELDGHEIISQQQLINLVAERKGRTVPIAYRRDGQVLRSDVTPDFDPGTQQVRIGIQFNPTEVDFDRVVHPTPRAQLSEHSLAIFRTLKALTTPSQSKATSKQVGGPLAILISYYFIVKASLMVAVFFTGFLNVNLAILNLLPIPILDGGHIVFCLFELVFRRPVPPRVVTVSTNVFATLLIAVFLLLTYRDAIRFDLAGAVRHTFLHHQATTNAPPR